MLPPPRIPVQPKDAPGEKQDSSEKHAVDSGYRPLKSSSPTADTWAVWIVHDLDAIPRDDALLFRALITRTPAVDLSIRAHEAIIDGRDVPAASAGPSRHVDAFSRADRSQSAIQQ
jgi:hypothetical protein